MKTPFLLILLISALLSSCSGKKAKTKANLNFILGAIGGDFTVFNGGAMLWGKRGGDKFAYNLSGHNSSLQLELNRGVWDFYVVGWEGNGAYDLTGDIKCGLVQGIDLQGEEAAINLTINNANCADVQFTPSSYDYIGTGYTEPVDFPAFNLSTCRDMTNVNVTPPSVTACNNEEKGAIQSFKVQYHSFTAGDVGNISVDNSFIESACLIVGTGSVPTIGVPADYPQILQGNNGAAPFKTIIKGYLDNACAGTNGFKDWVFSDGLHAPNGTNLLGTKGWTFTNSSIEEYHLFTHLPDSEVCGISQHNIGLGWSAGDGSLYNPYAICHSNQLNLAGDLSAGLNTKNFRLHNNLDMREHIQGRPNAASLDCVDLGGNFIPWGGIATDAPTCSAWITTPTSYDGTFYGNNKTISYLSSEFDDLQYIGLFRKLGSTGFVKNLTLYRPMIKGKFYVGSIAGASSGNISNVKVIEGVVESENNGGAPQMSFIGGIAGENDGVISLSLFHHGEVEGRGHYTGGIAGRNYGSGSISQVGVSAEVSNESRGGGGSCAPDIIYTGGITGDNDGTATIQEVYFSGSLNASGREVGGIAGRQQGGTIQQFYVNAQIHSDYFLDDGFCTPVTSFPAQVGGAIGNMSSGTVQKGIFRGKISHNCSYSTPANCKIGELTGVGSTTVTYSPSEVTNLGGTAGTVTIAHDDLLTTATPFNSGDISSLGSTIFSHTSGDYPRFAWEASFDFQRPCSLANNQLSVADQVSSLSRGANSTNPIILCNHKQLQEITSNADKYFKVQNNIYIGNFNSSAGNFNGVLDGDNYTLYGLEKTSGTGGLFVNIGNTNSSTKIENLKLFGAKISGLNNIGTLGDLNYGLIKNVDIFGGDLQAVNNYAGGIVAKNMGTGIIERASTALGVSGENHIGGIAGSNSGVIRKVKSYSYILSDKHNGSPDQIGGIAGVNSGTVEQANFSGRMEILSNATNIGGIVGQNNSNGALNNVSVQQYAELFVAAGSAIGGIIGNEAQSTGASLDKAFFAGRLKYGGYCSGASACGGKICKDSSSCIGNSGSWDSSEDGTGYGSLFGASVGATATMSYYINGPYNSDGMYQQTTLPSSTANSPDCDFNISGGGLSGYSSFNTGDHIQINETNYEIKGLASSILTVDGECSDLPSNVFHVEIVNESTYATPGFGTEINYVAAHDMDTFCSGLSAQGDLYECPAATGFDLVGDDQGTPGFDRLVDHYFQAFFDLPSEFGGTNEPIWSMRDGEVPELSDHW